MDGKRIIVRISPDGLVEAATEGFKGPSCLDSIQLLEGILEAQTVTSDFTPEYHEAPSSVAPGTEIEERDELR